MAWVQVGSHKINTANVCYIENKEETVLIHFHGQWAGNPLELKADQAKAMWKHLKAEDSMAVKDKGSTMVLHKRITAPMPMALDGGAKPEEKPKMPTPVGAGSSSSSHQQHRPQQSPSHSHSHQHSHSAQPSQHKPAEPRKV